MRVVAPSSVALGLPCRGGDGKAVQGTLFIVPSLTTGGSTATPPVAHACAAVAAARGGGTAKRGPARGSAYPRRGRPPDLRAPAPHLRKIPPLPVLSPITIIGAIVCVERGDGRGRKGPRSGTYGMASHAPAGERRRECGRLASGRGGTGAESGACGQSYGGWGLGAHCGGVAPDAPRAGEGAASHGDQSPGAGGCGAATSAASRGGHTTSAVGSERLDRVGGEPVPMPLLPPHTPARFPWSPTPDVLHLSGDHRPGGGLEGAPRPLTSACVLDWRRTITMVEVGPRTRGGVGGGGGPRVRAPPGERTCGGKQEICRFGSARPLPVEGTLPMEAARRTHRRARVVGVGRRRGGPAAGRWLPAGCPPAAAASGALKRRHGTTSTTSKRKNHSCDPGTGSSPPTTRIPDLLR